MKLIYRSSDITEAHIVSGLLNSNGIEAHVGGHYLQGGIGELAVSGFANVHVADEDASLAKSIIAEYEDEQKKPPKNTKTKKITLTLRLSVVLLATSFIICIYYFVSS